MAQCGCIAHCTFEYLADFVICAGPSMLPNIRPDDVLLTEHLSVRNRKLSVGDVVICRSVTNPAQYICKRVVQLEGCPVEIQTSDFVSNKTVPRGHVWLEGDNKDNSTDSRSYGPVPYGLLRSRALLRVWPLPDIGWLSKTDQ